MKIETCRECLDYIADDAYRYTGSKGGGKMKLFFSTPGFRYMYWLRWCSYLRYKTILFPFFVYAKWRLRACSYKFGIQIPDTTSIGRGFYIGHFGEIVINAGAVLGKNMNISNGVTIGQANRGDKKGAAIIGNNVYIGPGAKIVGAVTIGNNVAIGANAVVTRDLPDNAVAAGVPATVISMKGSVGYVNKTV